MSNDHINALRERNPSFWRHVFNVPRRLMAPACHQLPYGDIYQTVHSTPWHWKVANDNLVLLTQVGSGLHGVTDGRYDDRDEQGVCIEPPNVMVGFDRFRLYEYRTQAVGVRSGAGDLDLNVYGLHEWVGLICAGNPTHLLPLFAPDSEVVDVDWPGKEMRGPHRELFLARTHGARFLGYLNRQRARMLGHLNQRTNRPELIAEYGFDTKFAYHAMRIALQGIELMQTGEITLPMPEDLRRWLINVRMGQFSREYVINQLANLEKDLTQAMQTSALPERVDYGKVNDWLEATYTQWWEQRRYEEQANSA